MVTCLAIPWTEILLDKVSGIPMSLLSWSVVIFMLMIGVFLLEVAYVSINRKEINKVRLIFEGFFGLSFCDGWDGEIIQKSNKQFLKKTIVKLQ